MEWYYAVGEDRKGPVSESEFRILVQKGVINSKTLVWREGMTDWEFFQGQTTPPIIPGVSSTATPLIDNREAESLRNEYIKHEASVRSIGTLYYLGASVLIVMGIVLLVATVVDHRDYVSVGIAIFFIAVGSLQLWLGRGLRRLDPRVRTPTGVLAAIGLLGFPLGTLINAYILYLLFGEKGKVVFSDEYRHAIELTPHIKYKTSGCLIVLLCVLIVVLLLIFVAVLVPRL